MNSIISSLKDSINARLKNPFIGTFVFCWISLHAKGVGIFFLVDTPEKIEILRNKVWTLYGDAILPLLLALTYMIILPLINLLYDYFNSGWLIPRRLQLVRKKTIAQVQSETEYIRDYEYKNLSSLINAKEKLTASTIELYEIQEEYRKNSTMAQDENVVRFQSAVKELTEVVKSLDDKSVMK